jgi:glutaredoxin
MIFILIAATNQRFKMKNDKTGPSGQTKNASVFGTWTIAAIIGIIAILIIILAVITQGSPSGTTTAAEPQSCSEKVIAYINTNLASSGQTATLINITENNGVYTIWSRYQGRDLSIYASRDCTLLFTTAIEMNTAPVTAADSQACSEKVIAYINSNLTSPGQTATLINISETNGIYTIWSRYQGADLSVYATRDCNLLFPKVIDMNAAAATPVPTQAPVKSARPTVDLFVMAFCPYGTQAETVMRPVVDLLGTKADIRVRYITTVNGATVDSVNSLHGPAEAKEDLMQLCVMKTYPEKYWDYLKDFNNQCYPVWQNATRLDSCRKNVTAVLGIDLQGIEACATGAEGLTLLEIDEAKSDATGARASPTLVINGVKYAGARTPEAYKQAICNSFATAPAECNTTLSSTSAASSGGCE